MSLSLPVSVSEGLYFIRDFVVYLCIKTKKIELGHKVNIHDSCFKFHELWDFLTKQKWLPA